MVLPMHENAPFKQLLCFDRRISISSFCTVEYGLKKLYQFSPDLLTDTPLKMLLARASPEWCLDHHKDFVKLTLNGIITLLNHIKCDSESACQSNN